MAAISRGFHEMTVLFSFGAQFLDRLQVLHPKREGLKALGWPRRALELGLFHEHEKRSVGILAEPHPDPAFSVGILLVLDRVHPQIFGIEPDGGVRVLHFEENVVPLGKMRNEFERQRKPFEKNF